MVTKEQILELVEKRMGNDPRMKPIYEIVVFEDSKRDDQVFVEHVGFLHDLDDAVFVVEGNCDDIHETCYDAAFILCYFPGLYRSVHADARMYFEWDENEECYVQQEEPEISPQVECRILY